MQRFALPTVLLLLFALASCASQQPTAYLVDAPRDQEVAINQNYASAICPGDRLYIYVYSQTPEAVAPFNEETSHSTSTQTTNQYYNSPSFQPQGRLVGSDGMLLYPLLGSIPTTGLTATQLAHDLEQRLKESNYVSDPIVTVSLMNFRVTVIGEVTRPTQIHTESARLTIFEAIAQCGDITLDGLRDKVVVVRRDSTGLTYNLVDLTSRSVLESPYYYLRQNDIVYVPPTDKKRRTSYRNEDWPIYLNTGLSAINFAYTTIFQWFLNPQTQKMLYNN